MGERHVGHQTETEGTETIPTEENGGEGRGEIEVSDHLQKGSRTISDVK